MRASNNSLIKILSTGFIVLLLLSLLLFWCRWLFENDLIENALPQSSKEVVITPTGLLPDEIENEPNITRQSEATTTLRSPKIFSLGIMDYIINISSKGRNSNVYWHHQDASSKDWQGMYFDKRTGQIVCHYYRSEEMPDNTRARKEIVLYAGPEGVSDIPDKKLGKFDSPIADGTGFNRNQFVLYDGKLRCFFRIDFFNNSIVRGLQLSKDDTHNPVQIGTSGKNSASMIELYWLPPMYPKELEKRNERFRNVAWLREFPYLPVLDESGRIDLLDVAKLEFAGIAGYLPVPETLFPNKNIVRAQDLLAYQVLPLAFETDNKNRGMFVASVNREGTAVTLSVFDSNGLEIASNFTACEKFNWSDRNNSPYSVSTSKAIYNEIPMGPVNAIIKFLLENLQSPILSLASYFTADSFEAGSGHRALFILPNSFIGMAGRFNSGNAAERFIYAVLLMLPSIILSIFLAERICKDAIIVGLSYNERLLWKIGTIAFGLAAYITYRFTRPKITLVTCQNCGKPRRPDMDKCHCCKSKWHIPELIPPTWRILNS
ncbi:MAG: hypothetical protein JW787_04155 [Sedimentisphaerales bacterium]|nr:hypothetical protein [Sedimentisphaerales bacterium]